MTVVLSEEEVVFRQARNQRTAQYGVIGIFDKPIAVYVGKQGSSSEQGQNSILALVNILTRIHGWIHFSIPEVPLLTRRALFPGSNFAKTVHALSAQIDPFIHINDGSKPVVSIGLGEDAPSGLDWYIGFDGHIAIVSRTPVPFDAGPGSSLGGQLASCLGAAAVLKQLLGHNVRPSRISAWNWREGDEALQGPADLGPLNVGNILQVGAGGVGSCFAYWLWEHGNAGRWLVVDGDNAELHNTNRSMGIFPSDAGWEGQPPAAKAAIANAYFGNEFECKWYEDFDQQSFRPDVILPLANENNVRHNISCRGEPILLHATTSRTWESQLHRHIPGRDDCIVCRMPEGGAARFKCSKVPLAGSTDESKDTALPFLSASAGLMLLSSLFRLQHGLMHVGDENTWSLHFRNERRHTTKGRRFCSIACTKTPPEAEVRRRINANRKWFHIDEEAQNLVGV